ncbi:bile acid:sodium symporter family protein [Salegentibacter salegens]|uniref:Bile acid:Na+ symporter, BASS family n=1 Tax=Salegentibacter salegens TaxID=143223 RepID=A0A1M7HSE8_9FLAO|nr:bile acid:sodium symporter family protein [Salegentibacter salegens]PRX43183.1 BASS family bile acid:Na+ symporter [Salegentibacter salegens]SHM31263.1 bile acid:Na+ symporter, BASS family [Salegentibacter salegens]
MQQFADVFMPLSIALIMLGIGLDLCIKDFRRVFAHPRAIITGLLSQIFLLPLIAFLLIFFWPIDPVYKIGIMLLAGCPGGTASNLVTKMLKGKVALSVSLTAFNSFIILFSIPLVIQFSFAVFGNNGAAVELSFGQTMADVLLTVILPVMAGILLNELFGHKFGEKFHKALRYILPAIMLLAFIVVIFFDENQRNVEYLKHLNLFIPLIILNFTTIIAGYFAARHMKLKHSSAYTIAVEMGLQNSVLALFIANQLLKDKDISLVAIVYGSFSLITTFLGGWILKHYFKKEKNERA